jgi:hypothetical protein
MFLRFRLLGTDHGSLETADLVAAGPCDVLEVEMKADIAMLSAFIHQSQL